MNNVVSKTEFLKRYLENDKDAGQKKKKKPKAVKLKGNFPRMKIFDENIDLKSINFGDKVEENDENEAPGIAEIIDERPMEVKIKELYESSRWKKIDNHHGKHKKLGKTLSGLKAGLQNSKSLQEEVQELRKREKTQLNQLGDEISGKNAVTIIRDRKTGLKRDLNQEEEAKNKKAKENQRKYDKWGKGIVQIQDNLEKFKDDLYEMSKPLARYKDDEDLNELLKSIIHDGDPMSEYMKKKRIKDTPSYPVYSGPPAPPNRFRIQPGYRWDGVDRSNGFETKYFQKINTTKATQDEAYLWSVQDM